MKIDPWGMLRDARYAAPRQVERLTRGPGAEATAQMCSRLRQRGLAVSVGYFHGSHDGPDDVVAANLAASERLAGTGCDAYLSVKAPALAFDDTRLRTIAKAAASADMPVVFDSHGAKDADQTLDAVWRLLPAYPGAGVVLPARWRRSLADAVQFREARARIRVVKGEWADPVEDAPDITANYLSIISTLAGRADPVAVATHDPDVVEKALRLLIDAGTPCELEQLRGLPRKRTTTIAQRLGVPVRIYLPFGPGWRPYALDKALARPYLVSWMIKDWLSAAESPTNAEK